MFSEYKIWLKLKDHYGNVKRKYEKGRDTPAIFLLKQGKAT